MINDITLLGSSSGRNAGDAALIDGIQQDIDEACGKACRYLVPTIKPSYIRDNYPDNVEPVATLPWNLSLKMFGWPTYRCVTQSQASLIFDAVLFDRSLYNPLFNFLSTFRLMLPAARKKGRYLGFYNVTAGPVDTPAGQKMLREVADMMDFISVRDQDSVDLLQGLGVTDKPIILGADAAINSSTCDDERAYGILNSLGINPAEPILAININRYLDTWASAGRKSMGTTAFLDAYSTALDIVAEKLDVQFLFVCTQVHDVEVTQSLIKQCKKISRYALFSNTKHSHSDVSGVLGKVDLLFAMRLHALILASSRLTPVVGLQYQPKVLHYLRTAGLENYCLNFDDFTPDNLAEHILNGWEQKAEIRQTLEKNIPNLKNRAKLPARFVASLNDHKSVEDAFAALVDPPAV